MKYSDEKVMLQKRAAAEQKAEAAASAAAAKREKEDKSKSAASASGSASARGGSISAAARKEGSRGTKRARDDVRYLLLSSWTHLLFTDLWYLVTLFFRMMVFGNLRCDTTSQISSKSSLLTTGNISPVTIKCVSSIFLPVPSSHLNLYLTSSFYPYLEPQMSRIPLIISQLGPLNNLRYPNFLAPLNSSQQLPQASSCTLIVPWARICCIDLRGCSTRKCVRST